VFVPKHGNPGLVIILFQHFRHPHVPPLSQSAQHRHLLLPLLLTSCCLLIRLQLEVWACSANPGAEHGATSSLQIQMLLPNCTLLLTPLYTKRLCSVPLSEALLQPGRMPPGQVGRESKVQCSTYGLAQHNALDSC
jgi:hypothetical protein